MSAELRSISPRTRKEEELHKFSARPHQRGCRSAARIAVRHAAVRRSAPGASTCASLSAGDWHAELSAAVGGSIARFWGDWRGNAAHGRVDWLRPATDGGLAACDPLARGSFPLLPFCNRLRDAAMPAGIGHHPYFPHTPGTRLTSAVAAMWQADAQVLPIALKRTREVEKLRAGVLLSQLESAAR